MKRLLLILLLFSACTGDAGPRLADPVPERDMAEPVRDMAISTDTATSDATTLSDAAMDMMMRPDLDTPDMSADIGPDVDMEPPPGPPFVFGERDPFMARADGADVTAVFGPQGGYHTEHAAFVTEATVEELHLALIWAEVWRDDVVLARAGWEFFDTQWMPLDDGFVTELPPLPFDMDPQAGPAELRGSLELVDGRKSSFLQTINLVLP